jgi:hypothetical protein
MKRLALVAFFLSGVPLLFGDTTTTTTFDHVKIHRHKSADKRQLVDKVGVLAFNDDARKLTFASRVDDTLDVPYDDVSRVVFDAATHMRAGWPAAVLAAGGMPGIIASTIIAGTHVQDHWFYLQYNQQGDPKQALLVVPGDLTEKVISKAKEVFGDRVTVVAFAEKGEEIQKNDEIDKSRVPDLKSKHSMKLDKVNHPLPEVKPDKATIVVVCPPLAARNTGWGNQFKLHANRKVVAVNKMGTYSIAYVEPGKYSLISQAENANGFEIDLEAGKTYYFLQNTYQGVMKGETKLSRNSPEVVMYLLDGAYFSDWKRLN